MCVGRGARSWEVPVADQDDQPGRLAATVLATLQEHGPALVAEVAEEVRGEPGEWPDATGVVVEDPRFEALVRALVQRFVAPHAGDAGGADEAGLAAELVGDGAPSPLVRYAVHATAVLVFDRLVSAAGAETPAVQGALVRALRAAMGREFEVLAAFEAAVREIEDDEGTRVARLREAFLRSILEGPVRDAAACARRASSLKLDLTTPVAVVLVVDAARGRGSEDGGPARPFEDRVMELARRPSERVSPPVFLDPTPAEPLTAALLVPAYDATRAATVPAALTAACVELGLLGVRATAGDLADVPVVYHQLRADVPRLQRCAARVGAFTSHRDLFPYGLASALSDAEAEELVRREIGPLMIEARHAVERVETWKLLVRERLADAEAAARLGVSPSALGKRKHTLRRILGRDLATEPFRAQVASYVFELWEDDLPPPGDRWWSEGDV